MKVFTFNIEEKNLTALKKAAEEWFDEDGKQWPVGRLIRHILNDWINAQIKKRIAK